MRPFVVGLIFIATALPLFAQPATPPAPTFPKPLVDSVKIERDATAFFVIDGGGLVAGLAGQRVRDNICFPERKDAPSFSFDTTIRQGWTVRLVPQDPADLAPGCHNLQCSRTLQQLKANDLCDLSPAGSGPCITSTRALGACFGPECDALRANCKLEGNPRTCTLAVEDIKAACDSRRCGTAKPILFPDRQLEPGERASVSFPPESLGKPPYHFIVEGENGEVYEVTVANGGAACTDLIPETTTVEEVVVIPLDNTGVASWLYLNPINPACMTCDNSAMRPLAFENRTSDRSFSVSIDFPAAVSPALFGEGCKIDKVCKISRTIPPNNATIFDKNVLELVPKGTLLKFKVAFSDEVDKVSNATAYLRVSSADIEDPPDALDTKFATKLGAALDPFIAAVPDKFTDVDANGLDDVTGFKPCYPPATPDKFAKDAEPALCVGNRVYGGKYARHYTGLARIDLAKTLGRRADISASVNYRTSDFGVDDGNVVKLSEYGINVFGTNGIHFRFGRTTWANPANSISIFEKGDGYRFNYKYGSITHVVKRESAKSLADADNDDSRSIIGQLKSIPLNRWRGKPSNVPFFRGLKLLDVTAVRGEDKLSHVYRTLGAEVFYTFRSPEKYPWLGTLTGSAAAFKSSRHATTTTVILPRHGEGWVGLFTATWIGKTQKAPAGGFEPVRSYTVQFGKGSSDDTDTEDKSEDYIGEAPTFSGDTLLMSTFASKINAKGNTILQPSLANKRYLGLQIVDNTWSPLEELAKAFRVEAAVNSKSTTLRIRQYKFGRPVYATTESRDAVSEFSVEFAIEVPKGVRVTAGTGYMHTGKGIEPVIENDAWVVSAGVSLTL